MTLLERINGPQDLKDLTQEQLSLLAAEIRDVLVETVTRTSGHLGPNLGVVELTIALHRVFDSPKDKLVFDTGHQSYVHKLLTGRHREFHTLRQSGGLSGYPSRDESEHDLVENSHASTSLSYADGLAKAYKLRGEHGRTVVAVIGDGALTGGMAWEALNNIAVARDSRLVIVVNDNGRSYQPTIGGLASHLSAIRVSQRYEQVLDLIKTTVTAAPIVGSPLFGALHGAKKGLKDFLQPQVLFEDLGIKYIGPIDGHDEEMTEDALRQANEYGGPVLVHVITRKGFGYALAEQNEEDCLHQVPGTPAKPVTPTMSWTDVFAQEMVAIGGRRPDVVGITAAMLHPVGLAPFKKAYPDRVYDAGIAEQHAMTMAAGLAMAGLHPVVSIYATFLNRAFDQLLMDVALHRLPVTVTLDRAGVTGPDGASHNGMWDGLDPPGGARAQGRGAARRQPGRGTAQRGRQRRRRPHRRPLPEGHRGGRGRGGRPDRPDGRPGHTRRGHGPRRAPAGRRPDVRYLRRGRAAPGRPRHRRDGRGPALGQAGRRGHRRSRPPAPPGGHRRGQRPGRRVRRRGGAAAARPRR